MRRFTPTLAMFSLLASAACAQSDTTYTHSATTPTEVTTPVPVPPGPVVVPTAQGGAVLVNPAPGATQVVTTTTRVEDPTPQPTGAPQDDYVADNSGMFRHSGTIAYATGGVGDEELALIKSHADEYNLRLMSAMTDGAYIGKYRVRITEAKSGPVFEAEGDGPYFYVNLPPGTYNVDVITDGMGTQSKKMTLTGKSAKALDFRWKGEAFVPKGYVPKDNNQ